jgi:polar amino acid transport system substrate-binding protein
MRHTPCVPRCLPSMTSVCRLVFLVLVMFATSLRAEIIELGAEDAWYPYSGLVDGKARGFTLDLVRASYAAVGVDVKFTPLPYARCTAMVKSGHLLGCFDTSRTAIVEADFLWHKTPMFNASIMIYGKKTLTKTKITMGDLEGKRMNTKVIRDNSRNDVSALRKLALGRCEYALAFERVANLLIKENAPELAGKVLAVGVLETMALYTAYSKSFPQSRHYMEMYERGFDIISRNGRLKEIEKQWR